MENGELPAVKDEREDYKAFFSKEAEYIRDQPWSVQGNKSRNTLHKRHYG